VSASAALDAETQAELARLAALPWRDYEVERRAAARALGLPLRDADRAVYRLRPAATAAQADRPGAAA
jgi:hypothetical protein